jgi:hypothetical protein
MIWPVAIGIGVQILILSAGLTLRRQAVGHS